MHMVTLGSAVYKSKNLVVDVQLLSYVQLFVTLWTAALKPGFPILYHLPEFVQIHVHWVMPSNHIILCCPLLLLPSIFPSLKVFSKESALHIRWPKHWSFSTSISPSNEQNMVHWRREWQTTLVILASRTP